MLWTIIAAGFAGTTAAGAFNAFLIVASVERGVNPGTAGWIAAFTSGMAVVLRPLYGLVADHRRLDGFRFSALLLAVGCVGFIALAMDGSAGLLLVGALLGYGAGWGWSGLIQMAVVETYPEVPAAATGAMALGLALGQGVGPVLFGATAIRFGFNVAWLGVTVTAAVAAVLMKNAATLRLRRLGPSSKED
jgi:MFS family permease